MKRLLLLGALLLGSCARREEPPPAEGESLASIHARVKQHFPASAYSTNSLIPPAGTPPPPGDRVKLKIGLPWLLNDESAPWYLASELGYFEAAGIEAQLLPGGPGKNFLALLAASEVDIAVTNISTQVTRLRASPTPADLVMIGTILRRSPEIILALDPTVPADQPSSRALTPADLVGRRIGVEATSQYLVETVLHHGGLTDDAVDYVRVSSPDALVVGRVDAMVAWIVNQPRLLEAAGHRNWIALRLGDLGWDDAADVSVVRRDTLDTRPDVLRRYLWALRAGVVFMLDHPAEAAAITRKWATGATLSEAQILRRFALQESLVIGDGRERLLHLNLDGIDGSSTRLIRAGVIPLPVTRHQP